VPLQTTAPSVVHAVEELPAEPLDGDEEEEEDEEPVGEAAEAPEEGPETPWPIEGERVG
jgi:hypothetical protein